MVYMYHSFLNHSSADNLFVLPLLRHSGISLSQEGAHRHLFFIQSFVGYILYYWIFGVEAYCELSKATWVFNLLPELILVLPVGPCISTTSRTGVKI